ncbi:hypothetical protein HA402_014794 [Bradysia odoriphaga]|nr:hypothetical protein HA402_014794 [Bradysia odoriphaga]
MNELFKDYCKTSSVHCIKYITEPQLHWIERIWWIVTMIVCVIGSIIVSKEVYNKWQKSPVIVSFAEKYTRVSEIPFPSVTICPETKARSSILNFTQLYNRWIEDGVNTLEKEDREKYLSHIWPLAVHKLQIVTPLCVM